MVTGEELWETVRKRIRAEGGRHRRRIEVVERKEERRWE
jgi:hypothetical protein